jgi:hypothetical protein
MKMMRKTMPIPTQNQFSECRLYVYSRMGTYVRFKIYLIFLINESSPDIQDSISSTVLGTMLMSSV